MPCFSCGECQLNEDNLLRAALEKSVDFWRFLIYNINYSCIFDGLLLYLRYFGELVVNS